KSGDVVDLIGHCTIIIIEMEDVKSKCANVIITGLYHDKTRLYNTSELQFDYLINVQQTDLKEYVNSITNGYGANVVLECSGAIPAAKQGLDLLRKKGQYVQVGIFKSSEIPFDLEKIVQKEIRVIGSRSQKPADWEPSLQLLSTGDVNAEALITKELDIT